jgi:hypothetical protein
LRTELENEAEARGAREREEREPGGETWRRERKTETCVDFYAVAAWEEPVVHHGFVEDAWIHKFDSYFGVLGSEKSAT